VKFPSLAVLGLALILSVQGAQSEELDPENTLIIELANGRVVIRMLPDVAPQHVARIRALARAGFYDGLIFHRVIPGFVAQTGDPTGTGRGGSGKGPLPAEFSQIPFARGTVGMARTADPNSADSQFFICTGPAPHLNGQYTVWGQVVEGMELIDALPAGSPPAVPGRMLRVRLLADLD
jgi:cyclophilin family peptidyl-prolyl cis-trans isomerase